MKNGILSIGTVYLDINCPRFPHGGALLPEKEVVGETYEIVPGGSAFNFARLCAALDVPPVFIGKVGLDSAGLLLTELIDKAGVMPALIRSADVATNIGINFIDERNSSILTAVGSANQSLAASEVAMKLDEYFHEIKYLYLGGGLKLKSLLSAYPVLCQKAHEHGVQVILDHGRVTNTVSEEDMQVIRAIVPLVDYYFPSKEEFLTVWQKETVEEAEQRVHEISKALLVVKDAENGAIAFEAGKEMVSVPAFKVGVIHPVGAGDSFNAGFIKAQDMNMTLEQSLRFACATAALKISQKNLPNFEDVQSLLKLE